MSAILGLPPPLMRLLAVLMVGAVMALVAWALHLMQAATDRQEFSLMLAGCMVCSAAVGLSTVMVLTFTAEPNGLAQRPSIAPPASPPLQASAAWPVPPARPADPPWGAISIEGAPPG